MPAGNLGPAVILALAETFRSIAPPESDGAGGATLRVGAGVTMAEAEAMAHQHGFHLPPLPSSAPWATVGGMVANNGAGAASFRYGAIASWVEEIEAVLADGTPVVLGPNQSLPSLGIPLAPTDGVWEAMARLWPQVRKNSSGYGVDRWRATGNPAQLIAGSEGTLVVVTGVTLRLIPKLSDRGLYLLPLPDLALLPEIAAEAVRIGAETCEMFGRRLLDIARLDEDPELRHWSEDASALLLIGHSGGSLQDVGAALEETDRLARRIGRAGLSTTDPETMASLWSLRHRASPLIAARASEGFYSTQFMEDAVVPVPALPAYLEALERIFRDEGEGMDAVIFGHAGDGNLHVNPWIQPSNAGWKDRVRRVLDAVVQTVASLGGTLAGEHGDGRLRAPYLETIWGAPAYEGFQKIKQAFDPRGILNPGTILPLSDQDPLADLVPGPRKWPPPKPSVS
jgi:FAD/FMN-containing dehydrogenase